MHSHSKFFVWIFIDYGFVKSAIKRAHGLFEQKILKFCDHNMIQLLLHRMLHSLICTRTKNYD